MAEPGIGDGGSGSQDPSMGFGIQLSLCHLPCHECLVAPALVSRPSGNPLNEHHHAERRIMSLPPESSTFLNESKSHKNTKTSLEVEQLPSGVGVPPLLNRKIWCRGIHF